MKQDIAIFTPMANEEKNAKKYVYFFFLGKQINWFPCTYFGFTLRSFLLLAGALGAI
jgi:hypothetical protein